MIASYGFPEATSPSSPITSGVTPTRPCASPTCATWRRRPSADSWPTNLADDRRNLPYPNFGCAQQHNLAAQIANPADLLGPRTMDPADQERRAIVLDKYRRGETNARREERQDETRPGQDHRKLRA